MSSSCQRSHENYLRFGFAEEAYDGSAADAPLPLELGTEHTELIVKPDVEAVFDSGPGNVDEPFRTPRRSQRSWWRTSPRSKYLVLSGDGVTSCSAVQPLSIAVGRGTDSGGMLRSSVGKAALLLPHVFPWRNKLINIGRSKWGQYAATVAQPVRREEGGVAAHRHAVDAARVDEQLHEQLAAVGGWDFAAAMMQVDIGTYLPGDILTKVDGTTMAVSLEARVPLLDAELVDFALQIPGHLRVTAAESKRLFRRAIEGIVPASVLSRPKRGFEVPFGSMVSRPSAPPHSGFAFAAGRNERIRGSEVDKPADRRAFVRTAGPQCGSLESAGPAAVARRALRGMLMRPPALDARR